MSSPSAASRASPSCKAAQEREYARVLLLAREMEDEEDCARGVVRSIRSAGEALQHADQSGGDLIPVVERPLHRLAGQIVAGAREGLDRGLNVHGGPPALRKKSGADSLSWSRRARQML